VAAGAEPYGVGSIWLILLGAGLALGGSIAVEVWRAWRADRRKKSLIESILRTEIQSMVDILGIIKPAGFSPQTPVGSMQERFQALNHARLRVERYRHLLMLIGEDARRKALYDFLWFVELLFLETASRPDDPFDKYSKAIDDLKEEGEGLIEWLKELKT